MKKVVVILADGFEEVEAITPVDILRRAGIEVVTAAIGANPVASARKILVTADADFNSLDLTKYDMLILPGGLGGTNALKDSDAVINAIKKFAVDKSVAAICAAPTVLAKAGVLNGHKATCYPGCEDEFPAGVYIEQNVVVSGNIITSRGAGTAFDFSLELVKQLVSDDMAKKVAQQMIYTK